MAVTLCLSCSPDTQPEVQRPTLLGDGFFTASYQHLLWTPTHQGFSRASSVGCGFPYNTSSITVSNSTATATGTGTRIQLSYIIVQRPLDRPLDLWNRMFDRHQVEITVMQLRGHSLPVRQSMRVSGYFFSLSHFVSQFPPTRFPLLTAIGMCHFLPVHHLEWHFGPAISLTAIATNVSNALYLKTYLEKIHCRNVYRRIRSIISHMQTISQIIERVRGKLYWSNIIFRRFLEGIWIDSEKDRENISRVWSAQRNS